MRRNRQPFRLTRKQQILCKLGLILTVCLALVLWFDSQIRPLIKTMSAYQAKVYCTQVINDAVMQELAEENIQYDTIVNLRYSQSGSVTSIETDMIAVNRLKSNITNLVLKKTENLSNQSILIPIGTVLGGPFFSGRGPCFEVQIIPASFVESQLYNQFESAGINQTLHRIMIEIKMTVSAIVPGYYSSTEVVTNFCIAETVIVGLVPDYFTNVERMDPQTVRDIGSYQAEPPVPAPAETPRP